MRRHDHEFIGVALAVGESGEGVHPALEGHAHAEEIAGQQLADAGKAGARIPQQRQRHQQAGDHDERLRQRDYVVSMADLLDDEGPQHEHHDHQEQQQAVEQIDRVGRGGLLLPGVHEEYCGCRNNQAIAYDRKQPPRESLLREKVRHDPREQDRKQVNRRQQRDDALAKILDSRHVAADQREQHRDPQRHQPPAAGKNQQHCRANDYNGLCRNEFLLATKQRLPEKEEAEVGEHQRLGQPIGEIENERAMQGEQSQRQPMLLSQYCDRARNHATGVDFHRHFVTTSAPPALISMEP